MFFLTLFALTNICRGQVHFKNACTEYFYGDLNKAVALFDISISEKEELAQSYMYRGAAKSFLKMFPGALKDLNTSKKIDSTNPKLDYYFGKYYLFLKSKNDSALFYYSKAIRKNPQYAAAYDERATVKIMLNDFKGAIEDENKAIGIDSTQQIYYTDRGFALFSLNHYKEAIKDYNTSLQIEPNHKAFADRGYAYYKLGLQQMAIEDYTRALNIMPDDLEIYYRRGVSYMAIGKKEEACEDFTRSKNMGYEPALKEMKKNNCR